MKNEIKTYQWIVTVVILAIVVWVTYVVFTKKSVPEVGTFVPPPIPTKVPCQPPFAAGEYVRCYPSNGKE